MLRGRKVNYVPGWDCHGLPIELKALGERNTTHLSPLQIRQKGQGWFPPSSFDDLFIYSVKWSHFSTTHTHFSHFLFSLWRNSSDGVQLGSLQNPRSRVSVQRSSAGASWLTGRTATIHLMGRMRRRSSTSSRTCTARWSFVIPDPQIVFTFSLAFTWISYDKLRGGCWWYSAWESDVSRQISYNAEMWCSRSDRPFSSSFVPVWWATWKKNL